MGKLSAEKIKKLVTLLLTIIIGFVLVNQFILAPQKKKQSIEENKKRIEEEKKQKPSEPVISIKTVDVIQHDYVDILESLGNIKGGLEFKISFQVPGTIKAVNYREGEKYKKGALLVSLDEEDIVLRMQRVEAQMRKAQTALEITEQKYNEHAKLFSLGGISKSALDGIRLEVDSAEYDLEAAKLELKSNEAVLGKTNIYAVSDGMIGELFVEEGEVVTANTLIGTHILTEYVKAEFGVVEGDVRKIREGYTATVYVDAYPGQEFQGVIDSIAKVVGGVSRTTTVSVKLDNKENLLLPGMFARVRVKLFQKKDAIIIPTESIVKDEDTDEAHVFIIAEDEEGNTKAMKRDIVIGYERSDYSQIDEGLEPGETIATTSLDRLKEDAKVNVIEKQALEYE